jgi:hypothetical protein
LKQLGKKQRTFCIMGQQVIGLSEQECVAKANFKIELKFNLIDPKPTELFRNKLRFYESDSED